MNVVVHLLERGQASVGQDAVGLGRGDNLRRVGVQLRVLHQNANKLFLTSTNGKINVTISSWEMSASAHAYEYLHTCVWRQQV